MFLGVPALSIYSAVPGVGASPIVEADVWEAVFSLPFTAQTSITIDDFIEPNYDYYLTITGNTTSAASIRPRNNGVSLTNSWYLATVSASGQVDTSGSAQAFAIADSVTTDHLQGVRFSSNSLGKTESFHMQILSAVTNAPKWRETFCGSLAVTMDGLLISFGASSTGTVRCWRRVGDDNTV